MVVADLDAGADALAEVVGTFDCIVAADVLEHLRDPWALVRAAAERLRPGGTIVVSVPNVRHLRTVWEVVVRARWPYEGIGLFDRTHLRWFARRNLPELPPRDRPARHRRRPRAPPLHRSHEPLEPPRAGTSATSARSSSW